MARKRRIEFPGAFYHVFARGNNRQVIFKDNNDYRAYIDRIARYKNRYKFLIYAFVLMPNHVHLLVETRMIPLSKIMQGIQQSYTLYFHKKYKTLGHLFQGRYKAILCQQDVYLLELVRYIHLNPVRAALVKSFEDYPWSSHIFYSGDIQQSFVSVEPILGMFSGRESSANSQYLEFLNAGQNTENQERFFSELNSGLIGDQDFIDEIKCKVNLNGDPCCQNKNESFFSAEVPLIDLLKIVAKTAKLSSESILSASREQKLSDARKMFAFIAVRYTGSKMKEIGEFLGRDPSGVSLMVRNADEKISKDVEFCSSVNEILNVINV
jgi:REP element-mobilizing transposase RayT